MKHALISVHDKTGIIDFAKKLHKLGFIIISTGGTYTTLKDEEIPNVKHVSEVTGFPEILEGRIKTLHPKLLAGVLAIKNSKNHMKDLHEFQIAPIDLVVCNLYPFKEITKKEGTTLKTALENIDIGGPNMVRAAAKNFENVVVVVKPSRYMQIIEQYKKTGDVSFETRKVLAIEAFKETSQYDSAISKFLEKI